MRIALAHDYVTQRGGAERVALSMTRAFPGAPLYTTLYEPRTTFPEFADVDVRPSRLNRSAALRRNHRLALPLLGRDIDGIRVDGDVLLASSSGWAHGIPFDGPKIVYCHAPARWLYQTDRYAGAGGAGGVRSRAVRGAISVLGASLRDWDQRAAHSADRYVVNSTVIQRAVKDVYGIDAEVLAPPPATLALDGASRPVDGVRQPFVLCVARLLPYKNVDVVIEAVSRVPGVDLVVVGDGPDRRRLQALADEVGGTTLAGRVEDDQLRWLYENCLGLVAASYEDFGLSPLEAASFGKPTAALRDGGYLDTIAESVTGVYFERPDVDGVAAAVDELIGAEWSSESIRKHAEGFSEERFVARLREIVEETVR